MPAILGLSIVNGFVLTHASRLISIRTGFFWFSEGILAALILPYLLAILWGGLTVMKEDRLEIDLTQGREIREILGRHVKPETPVLVLSETGAPRLYYLSGHPPYNRYLHYGVNFRDRFTYLDAITLLKEGKPPVALIDVPDPHMWFRLLEIRSYLDNGFELLRKIYDVFPLEHGHHPVNGATTFVLVKREAGAIHPPVSVP